MSRGQLVPDEIIDPLLPRPPRPPAMPPPARSSTASPGRGPRPRRSTAPWPARGGRVDRRSSSRSRSRTSSAAAGRGSAGRGATSTTSAQPAEGGACATSTARSSSSARRRPRRRSGPGWSSSSAAARGRRLLPRARDPDASTASSRSRTWPRRSRGALGRPCAADAMITRKSRAEIDKMRRAGRIVAEVLALVEWSSSPASRPATSTASPRATSGAPARSRRSRATSAASTATAPFPASTCISIDDEVVHGIPGERVIRDGQIVSVDVGAILDGWHGDGARTFVVGDARRRGGARRHDPRGDDGRDRAAVPRQPRRRHLGRGRGRRPGPTGTGSSASSWATASGPRCTRTPGPELPDRPARAEAPARALPGDRADVHARGYGRRSWPTTGRSRPPTARWPPTSSTPSPSPTTVPEILTVAI